MSDFQIFKNFARHISLSEHEKETLESSLILRQVSKRELLLAQGQSCNKLFFVESGSLRAYSRNEDGKESTVMFAVEDWWITDMNSFVNRKPALLSIEALESSQVIEIDYDSLEKLYEIIPKFERFFRILFQKAYIREQLRSLHNISLTTQERYLHFIAKYPTIVEKITQKQIATYLGVSPEFLSAIKRK